VIRRLWLYPPLAFGRLGPSQTPCDSFRWGPNDTRPRGTGKTTIQPVQTLRVALDGTVTASVPGTIRFKDAAGFKPVCPFFELHGMWELDGQEQEGPITPDVLATFGLGASDLRWRVEVANLKPFHYTLAPDDRIAASVELRGDVTERQVLAATAPPGVAQPLLPGGARLPLGSVQLTRPNADFPEFRLRFTPAIGAVYGPTNLPARSSEFVLPPERLILNPNAPWCQFRLRPDDPRTVPVLLFARDATGTSLGLVDDVCDGVVHCSLPGVARASARIVVGPPDYAPDRRPFTSLADGLADRVTRHEVADPAYVEDVALTSLEVRDFFERALETMENVNVDAQNDRTRQENPSNMGAFLLVEPLEDQPLPLTQRGRQKHRRFVALEVLEDVLRENPSLIRTWIREPLSPERSYNQQMPPVMRGSDGRPMHITRRQYDLLVAWARHLRRDVEPET
jgi:hypothetical protein